jgi:hypothetical protein
MVANIEAGVACAPAAEHRVVRPIVGEPVRVDDAEGGGGNTDGTILGRRRDYDAENADDIATQILKTSHPGILIQPGANSGGSVFCHDERAFPGHLNHM